MVGVLSQLGVSVPGGDVEDEVEEDPVVFFRKQTLEYGDQALWAPSAICSQCII